MFITSMLQFLDKTAINYANLFGIRSDINLSGSQFSWLASIFYLGYLVSQFPAAYILTKFPSGKVMGICTVLWGVAVIVFPWSKDFAGLFLAEF
jgi:MFS family permease